MGCGEADGDINGQTWLGVGDVGGWVHGCSAYHSAALYV